MTRYLAAFAVWSGVALGIAQAQQVTPSPAEREAKAREFFTVALSNPTGGAFCSCVQHGY